MADRAPLAIAASGKPEEMPVGDTVDSIYLPVFGTQFQVAQDVAVSTTTATAFTNKVTMNLVALPAGTYRVGVAYGWNHDAQGNDFEARVQLDAADIGEIHKQEPKDSAGAFGATGTSQRHLASRTHYLVLDGDHTITLDFRTDVAGTESSIWDATIELWRVN